MKLFSTGSREAADFTFEKLSKLFVILFWCSVTAPVGFGEVGGDVGGDANSLPLFSAPTSAAGFACFLFGDLMRNSELILPSSPIFLGDFLGDLEDLPRGESESTESCKAPTSSLVTVEGLEGMDSTMRIGI